MSEKVWNPSFKDAPAKRRQTFRDAADAYQYFTGETMSADEAADAFWYVRLRQRMVALRKQTVGNQANVASGMGTSQSEVSRLENGLGPGTRLGTLRSYLAVCRTSLEELMASLEESPESELQDAREEPNAKPKMRLVIESQEFTGVEAEGVLESLHALNNLLRHSSLDRQERKAFILGVLYELTKVREGASSLPNWDFDVQIAVPDEVHEPIFKNILEKPGLAMLRKMMVKDSSTLSASAFRELIAEPLNLSDF